MNKLHIGYPKTATTYLQKVIFPQSKNHIFIDHSKFRNSGLNDLIWKADRSLNYKKFKEIYSEENYLISFENLVGPYFQGSIMIDEMPRRLEKIFGTKSKILITIRKQDDLLKSLYLQYIHQGGTSNFRNFILNPIAGNNRIDLNAFDFCETYKRYKDIFGHNNITIVPYEYLKLDREKFIMKLKLFLEDEEFDFNDKSIKNRSMSGMQIKGLRFLNRFLMSRVSEKYIIPPKFIDQNSLRFKWQNSDFMRFGLTFSPKEIDVIENTFKQFFPSNKELDNVFDLNLKELGYY